MRKQLGFLVLGAAFGALGTYALTDRPIEAAFSAAPERDIGEIAPLSVQAAEQHRAERYAEITTIAETLALPTDFAQTEALYVIAGRSTSAELQDLIHDAARISERLDRAAALQILFLRLTELDPMSAVAIAQSPAFANERSFERFIWENWGRVDLEGALDVVSRLSGAERRRAAQSLYASLRGIDDAQAQYIESTLGVAPDRNAQMLRIAALAEDSPVEALTYVESLPNSQERLQFVGSLAMTIVQRYGLEQAGQYTELLQDDITRQIYEATLNNLRARRDPSATLERALAGRITDQSRTAAIQAYQQLLAQDLDAAESWYRRTEDKALKQNFGQVLAMRMASKDPQRALAWVKSEGTAGNEQLLATVLSQLAQSDPDIAMLEAQAITDYRARTSALSSIINTTAANDPARAAQLLALVADNSNRQSLITQVAQQWARKDWRAAYEWVEASDVPNRRAAQEVIGMALLRTNLDEAQELLTRLPPSSGKSLRRQLASHLARERSIAEAERFVDQYKNDEDYDQMLGILAMSAMNTQPDATLRLAQRIQDDDERDGIYTEVLAVQADSDPRGALQRLDLLRTENGLNMATHRIVSSWQRSDPQGALNYVINLPPGINQDNSLNTVIQSLEPGSDQAMSLAGRISDPQIRDRALLNQLNALAANNPARAQQLLGSTDLNPSYVKQIQAIIDGAR
ncbi:MAG: hypothetical protein AAGA95_08745 [Pseudomonadota bacterium]